jgi:putative endonuclease
MANFTSRYRVTRLVYFETFADIRVAIAREKELKGWVRIKKTRLIESRNPTWEDFSSQSGSLRCAQGRLFAARA